MCISYHNQNINLNLIEVDYVKVCTQVYDYCENSQIVSMILLVIIICLAMFLVGIAIAATRGTKREKFQFH